MKLLDHIRLKGMRGLGRLNYGICTYQLPARGVILDRILNQPGLMLLTPVEAYQLWVAATSTAKLPGDVAEVGVYKGGSARLLSLALPDKPLHLFDTFEGLPDEIENHPKGQYAGSLAEVKAYVPKATFYRGLFPQETGHMVESKRFSFVHLDMDLYEGTRDALAFFFERMTPGGIILTHDFRRLDGPTKAFTEFFADRPDPMIELSGYQCMAVKL